MQIILLLLYINLLKRMGVYVPNHLVLALLLISSYLLQDLTVKGVFFNCKQSMYTQHLIGVKIIDQKGMIYHIVCP